MKEISNSRLKADLRRQLAKGARGFDPENPRTANLVDRFIDRGMYTSLAVILGTAARSVFGTGVVA